MTSENGYSLIIIIWVNVLYYHMYMLKLVYMCFVFFLSLLTEIETINASLLQATRSFDTIFASLRVWIWDVLFPCILLAVLFGICLWVRNVSIYREVFFIFQDAFTKSESQQDLLRDDFEVLACDNEEKKQRRRRLFFILLVAAITTGLLLLVAALPFLLGRFLDS